MPSLSRFVPIFVIVALASSASPAVAALISYESFAYGPVGSNLNGNAGGPGFSGPWKPGGFNAALNDNYDIAVGSLDFGDLLTGGNHVTSSFVGSIAGITRDFGTPLGTAGTTVFFSFLLRPEGALGQGAFNGFFGLVLEQPGEPEIFAGNPGGGALGQYVVEARGGGGQVTTGVNAAVGQTAFVVLKAQFNAGNDTFTLYVNPTPGGPEPVAGAVKNDADVSTVQGLTIYSTGAFAIDEIRVGDTFGDVTPLATPVPEPATLALVSLGLGAAVRRRWTALAGQGSAALS